MSLGWSVGNGKNRSRNRSTSAETVQPQIQGALDFLVDESMGAYRKSAFEPGLGKVNFFGGNGLNFPSFGGGKGGSGGAIGSPKQNPFMNTQARGSLVPDMSADSLVGMGLLRGQFVDNPAADVLEATAQGDYLGSNPFTVQNNLSGVTDAITAAATQAVGDRFSQAGRSGSPAEAMTLGKTVARELAPYAFGANESALGRGFSGYENERARQAAAIPQVFNMRGQEAENYLNVGGLLEGHERQQALEPFERIGLTLDPLKLAILGAPRGGAQRSRSHNDYLQGEFGMSFG